MHNTPSVAPEKGFIISGKLYDRLKFLALVLFPALSTLYFTLGSIWGLPYVTQVIGTVSAVDVFLGIILGISSASYKASDARFAGSLDVIEQDDGVKTFQLSINAQPEDLISRDAITFKVNRPEGS